MEPLNCLTPFLESGKKFKLPSGETFDELRDPPEDAAPVQDVQENESRMSSSQLPDDERLA